MCVLGGGGGGGGGGLVCNAGTDHHLVHFGLMAKQNKNPDSGVNLLW